MFGSEEATVLHPSLTAVTRGWLLGLATKQLIESPTITSLSPHFCGLATSRLFWLRFLGLLYPWVSPALAGPLDWWYYGNGWGGGSRGTTPMSMRSCVQSLVCAMCTLQDVHRTFRSWQKQVWARKLAAADPRWCWVLHLGPALRSFPYRQCGLTRRSSGSQPSQLCLACYVFPSTEIPIYSTLESLRSGFSVDACAHIDECVWRVPTTWQMDTRRKKECVWLLAGGACGPNGCTNST